MVISAMVKPRTRTRSIEDLFGYTHNKPVMPAVILAHTLQPDHTISWEGILRVDKGLWLYDKNRCSTIVMSGGYAKNSSPEISHAEAMLRYAVQRGQPLETILKEEKSPETVGQAFFVKQDILIPRNWGDLYVVSSDYHMDRVEVIFEFVLGNDFKIHYEGVNTGKTKDKARMAHEAESINAFKVTFKGVTPGNDEQIRETMLTRHTLYKGREDLFSGHTV